MNHHKFLICMMKYHLQFWCLVIYKPFYQVIVYCNTRYYFLKLFFFTNSDPLQFFCHEFINQYYYFFDCPYTLVIRCGRVSGIKPILVVLNFCLDKLNHVTLSHDMTRSKRWCQWPVLLRTYRTVNFRTWDSGI